MNRLISFLFAIICAMTVWAGPRLSGSGTKADPYLIGSLNDWREFAIYVNNNYTEFDEYFLMTADIGPISDFNYLIGIQAETYTRPFKGIFDGGGHTLTMDFNSEIFGYIAPFFLIDNATIKNLHVTGEVTVAEPYAGGIVLEVWDAYECNTIENCRVSTKIICNASTSGECMIGGFVCKNQYKELNITGCVFDGQIIAPNVPGCAGFVGWNDTYTYGHVNIKDCVFAPAAATVQGGKTFVRSEQYGDYVTISNSYYTASIGDVQGKATRTITGNEGVTVAMAGEPIEYNMSGIIAYSGSAGLKYNGSIYGGNGDVVALNLSGSEYSYTSSTGKITGIANPFTLTMEDANAVVSATQAGDFYLITKDSELRSLINTNGVNIQLAADIDLSNSTLNIAEGKTVTIDLAGHVLDRKLTKRGEGGGQVITVREGATLNLSNGTLKGGWGRNGGGLVNEGGIVTLTDVNITGNTADDRGGGISNQGTLTMTGGSITSNTTNDQTAPEGGGGIMNSEGATATLTNVSITGNTVKVKGGGGICNYGTMALDGCTVTGNFCQLNGGGIWNKGTLNMQGVMTITGNTTANSVTNNLFLKTDAIINVTGALTGSSIGISMEAGDKFTKGYSAYHSLEELPTLFTIDNNAVYRLTSKDDEGLLAMDYIERSWDTDDKTVVNQTKSLYTSIGYDEIPTDESEYKLVKSVNGWFALGGFNNDIHEYYVVCGDVSHTTLNVLGRNVHLVLCNGAKLTLSGGILMYGDHNLYIHCQSYDASMGKLVAQSGYDDYAAGIGSNYPETGNEVRTPGNLEIHGGDIYAKGAKGAAGIGGGYEQDGGLITIYGGKVEAHGNDGSGAGIGGGEEGIGGTIDIYDGTIKAYGGESSAGIGGGPFAKGGTITFYGGEVYAYGGNDGAGIGGGWDANGGDVSIYGGYVYAKGNGNGAGIGSGCEATFGGGVQSGSLTVTDGRVEAYGGEDAAGIGGGEDADCGTINIYGGYVYAEGKDYGAGIGGGQGGDGGNVTITGGTVIAKAGRNETGMRAIGPGEGSDEYGSLTIGDEMMVSSERMAIATERKNMCWYRTQARIEPCTHQDHSYTWSGTTKNDTHTEVCQYCTTAFEAEQHIFEDGVCTVCGVELTIGTGIENVNVNGNVNHAEVYDLSGRKMVNGKWLNGKLPKGIYINNGKKKIVK